MKNKLTVIILMIGLTLPSLALAKIKGNYNSPIVTGDFKHSSALKNFIQQMSSKHRLDKNYLNGLFSKVKNRKSTLRIINRPVKTTGISKGSWNRYKNRFISSDKANKAARFYRQNKTALYRAAKRYGIPAEYIVAIISMETALGRNFGKTPIIDGLTTIAFGKTRRSDYFKQELEEFLMMCKDQNLDPRQVKGSYAGAMGYGQFMPSSFRKYAVDFNNDGKKDLWNPTDAIGSIANYFKINGWQKNKTVAIQAHAVGNKYKVIDYGWRYGYSLAELKSYGISPKSKIKINSSKLYFIKLITYKNDELWIGGHNFYVITRYNNSSKYAMSVYLLASKIKNTI